MPLCSYIHNQSLVRRRRQCRQSLLALVPTYMCTGAETGEEVEICQFEVFYYTDEESDILIAPFHL